MNKILYILILMLIPKLATAQKNADGLYLEVEEDKCYYSKLKVANTNSTVCVLDNPLISAEEFKAIGRLYENPLNNMREFSVTLSESGKEKLSNLTQLYVGRNFAFVLDQNVVCLMEVKGKINSGKIIVSERLRDSSLKNVRQKLIEERSH